MDITTFATGAMRDTQNGKPSIVETSSPWANWRYAKYMTSKKPTYGEGNFKKGIPKESYLESMYRHLVKLLALEDCKKFGLPVEDWMEPNEDHAAAIRFNDDGFMHEEEIEKAREAQNAQQIDRGLGYAVDVKVSGERKCVNPRHAPGAWKYESCDEI